MQWKEVNQFFETESIKLSDIEPSKVSYREVQRNQINTTIYNEKGNIKDIDTNTWRDIYNKSKPTFKQGAYISAIAASLEGVTAFITAIIKKSAQGKLLVSLQKMIGLISLKIVELELLKEVLEVLPSMP